MTNAKQRKLQETYVSFKDIASSTFQTIRTSKPRTYTGLHHAVYRDSRRREIASQLVEEAQRYAWQRRKITDRIVKPTVRFDKRLFSWSRTRRGHPVLSVRCNSERLGLPIHRDGAYRRLLEQIGDGWVATSVLMTCRYRFLVLLKKNPPAPRITENVLGVDQNSNGIEVTVMEKRTGRILKQLYLGRDVSLRQIKYESRRAELQEYRGKNGHRGKAGLKLRRLSGRQRNYVRTNTWLLTRQLTDLAKQYEASIAIKRLYKLTRRKGQLSRRSRRKTNRYPTDSSATHSPTSPRNTAYPSRKSPQDTQARHAQDADTSPARTAETGDTSAACDAASKRMPIVSQA